MNILAYFSNNGVPATGLTTPTIRIRELPSGTLIINDSIMTETGDGFYIYDFTTYDKDKNYSIRCDGTAVLSDADRYVYAGNENYIDDIASGVWDETINQHIEPNSAATALKSTTYGSAITLDIINGVSGTGWPVGTHYKPSNNLTDALTIMQYGNVDELILLSNVTIESYHDISNKVIKTIGKMGTSVTFSAGCSANNTTIKNANLSGTITAGDELLIYDCQIENLENFKGIMNNVSFEQGSDISFNSYATIIQGTAGGNPTNEPEFDIGSASINISQWTGNLKLKGKNSNNRTVVNCDSGNILIDSTCVSGTIQLLGIGQIEKDESGPNCKVDIDSFISKDTIASAVWDEELVNHVNDETTGHSLMYQSYDGKIFIDTINGSNGSVYPFGIRQHPVKSISDALNLYNNYGLSTIHIIGSLTISGGEDISGFTFTSDRSIGNSLNIVNAITSQTYFDNLTISGSGNGIVRFTYCVIDGFNNLEGGIKNSLLLDDIKFTSGTNNYMTDVDRFVYDINKFVNIDIDNSSFNMIRCRGNYCIKGKVSNDTTAIDLVAGIIKVDSTCVSGTIGIGGVSELIDESGPNCNVVLKALSNPSISNSVWSEETSGYTVSGSFGYLINNIDDSITSNENYLKRIIGLVHENIFIDNPIFDSDGNMTAARLRIYSNPTDVGTSSGVIGTYNISAPGNGPGKFTNWSQIRIS
jgi:hypothetical protein